MQKPSKAAAAHWRAIVAVVADPFAGDQLAAAKAAAVARRCGARLTLLNTFMIPQPTPESRLDSREQIIAAAIKERRVQLERLAAKLGRKGIAIEVAVEWDYPAHEAIVRYVLKSKPDLLMSESHRHGRLARWVLANTDWELMRHCPCALWFVRSAQLPAKPKLLVAVDPRHSHAKPARLDERLLQAAGALTAQLGGAIEIAHAYTAPMASSTGMLMEPFRVPRSAPQARASVEALRGEVIKLAARHGVEALQCLLVEGEPAMALPALVKKRRSDVLVMGAVSRGLLARPVIGNTAEKVIDQVECDVFVVKPAGFKTHVGKSRPKP